ncbi:MAG: DsbA family oxidoreductase [Rhodobacteraceae bacterium]|nr:DsbA family oxidoreductase [Paracoccaceae bacterium]MCZ8083655.1 DsbA family oxidoreductase [Paracoccaceae bacterium]
MIRLDIFSDPVCPWCLIGKANLDRAMESRPNHVFQVQWHPFQLNPDMPKEGVGHVDYLAAKFGSREKAIQAMLQVAEHAKKAGAEIDMEKVTRLPNTLDAHRLIHWAGIEGRQTAMVARLFKAHWREGADIGDAATLARLAGEVGMDAAAVARLLATDADADDIRARDMDARQKGVTAVPTFLIAQQYVVSGAQPVEMWQQVIDELAEKIAQG